MAFWRAGGLPQQSLRAGLDQYGSTGLCTQHLPHVLSFDPSPWARVVQVAGARAERDTLADQNAALARTTHQLMAGGTSSQHDGSMSPGGVGSLGSLVGPVSAPVSLSGAAGDGSISLLPVRPRVLSEPASAEPGGAAAGALKLNLVAVQASTPAGVWL
jgi:hypothetical protein